MNAGLPAHFSLLLKESANGLAMITPMRALIKSLKGLTTWFIAQSRMLYSQIVFFYWGDLEKEKLTSQLKVSGVMINDRASDSVIQYLAEFVLITKFTAFWNCGSTKNISYYARHNAISKKSFPHWTTKDLPTIYHKSLETKKLMVVHIYKKTLRNMDIRGRLANRFFHKRRQIDILSVGRFLTINFYQN